MSTNGLVDMRYNLIFNHTEYGSRIREGAHGNIVRNFYIGGKKDPLVLAETRGAVYSVGNQWKYRGVEDRKIDDVIDTKPFPAPFIYERSKREVLQLAGCLPKSNWETKVFQDIMPFLRF